jgi:hypothetical protein
MKNQFMKKSIFISTAVLAGSLVFAQQKKEKPSPPPPPPVLDAKVITPPPPPPPAPQDPPKVLIDHFTSPDNENYKAFLRNNPSVKSVSWSENKISIHLQSGKEEVFNLNNKEQMEKFQQQYGELPIPPPPPPPPARLVAPKNKYPEN